MKILPYVFSILGLISVISASLIKGRRMKLILFLVFCANAFVGTSYLLGGIGMNGAAACYLGSVMTIINYVFESKNKPIPKWLIGVYVVAIIALNIWVAGGISPIGTLAIVASLSFIMCIIQGSGAMYRFWTIVNMVLWCTYDVIAPAYSALATHIPQLTFTVIGMIIHDRKRDGM